MTIFNNKDHHRRSIRLRKLDEFVVMPNRIPGILILTGLGHGTPCPYEKFGVPTHNSIPTIIRVFKSAVARQINMVNKTLGHPVCSLPTSGEFTYPHTLHLRFLANFTSRKVMRSPSITRSLLFILSPVPTIYFIASSA